MTMNTSSMGEVARSGAGEVSCVKDDATISKRIL